MRTSILAVVAGLYGAGGGGGVVFPLTANELTPQIDAFFGSDLYTKDGSTEIAFSDLITHARNSVATYVDASGIIQSVTFNVPRTDHHVGGVKGYLHEQQGRNELTYSTDFTNAAWVKEFCSVTADQTASPDGGVTADLMTATGSGSVHRLYQVVGGTATQRSVFAKAGTATFMSISAGSAAGGYVIFNLATGEIAVESGMTGIIEAYGNGFYRCTCLGNGTHNVISMGTTQAQAVPATTWDASGETMYVWGGFAQIGGRDVTTFIYTEAAKVTRLADVSYIPIANMPYPSGSPLAVSVAMEGFATYSDNNTFSESIMYQWLLDTNNFIEGQISTFPSAELWYFLSKSSGSQQDNGRALDVFSGANVPMNVAARHGAGFIQMASDGVAATANTAGTTFPNLSARNFYIGQSGTFHFKRIRIWGGATGDIAEAGLVEATS